jgi:hypothetical protein
VNIDYVAVKSLAGMHRHTLGTEEDGTNKEGGFLFDKPRQCYFHQQSKTWHKLEWHYCQ